MEFHDRGDGVRIAFSLDWGNSPTVVFLHGFGSDMSGEKANRLAAHLKSREICFLRLDCSGHGASDGSFEDGSIGRWRDDALSVIDSRTSGELILVGSSMGGWIAMLIALARPDRVVGLIGIAAAPDFTEWGMWRLLTRAQRGVLMEDGSVTVPAPFRGHLRISRAMIDDGRINALLDGGPIPIDCSIRLLHGQKDADVPWQNALVLAERFTSNDVRVVLTKDADHSHSRPSDLLVVAASVDELLFATHLK